MTQDFTLLLILILASFLVGIFIGKTRLIAVLINAYIAAALMGVIPSSYLHGNNEVLIFLILVVGLTIIGKNLFEIYISGAGSGFMWRVFAMSFLEVVMILSIILTLLPKKTALTYVSSTSYGYLAEDPMKFVWMAAPLAFLFFIQKKIR